MQRMNGGDLNPILIGLSSFAIDGTNFYGSIRGTIRIAKIDRELNEWSETNIKPTTGYSFWAEKQEIVNVRIYKEFMIILTRTPLRTPSSI